MEKNQLALFDIIGIAVRTTNENGQAGKDIEALWERFMAEKVQEKIPNKIDNDIYGIYTDYESDHTKPYTAILGCKVHNLSEVPEGFVSKKLGGGNFVKFEATGDLRQGIVYQKWLDIWEMDLDRTYSADFEIYGKQAQNPSSATVEIHIATN